jgi:hypothetical protein
MTVFHPLVGSQLVGTDLFQQLREIARFLDYWAEITLTGEAFLQWAVRLR